MEKATEAPAINTRNVFFKGYSGCSIFARKMRKYTDSIDERLTGRHRKVQRKRKIGDWQILRKMEWKIAKLEVFKKVGIPKFIDYQRS